MNNLSNLNPKDFKTEINGKKTELYILRNVKGYECAITNYGGAIVSLMVPDKEGQIADVIQGHDNIKDVINSAEPYLSTLIGRLATASAKVVSHSMARITSLP